MALYEPGTKLFWEQPESRRLEFKESFPKGEQIAKTAVAFSNGGGGKIVFGVQDSPREIVGIPDDEIFLLEERIAAAVFTLCAPNIVPEISIRTIEDKTLMIVDIFPGSHKPYYLKKKGKHQGAYIRVGSANRQAGAEMLEELERQRRNVSFDSVPVYDLQWTDIDLSGFISDFKRVTGKNLDNARLENLGLMVRERDRLFPSYGAILLSDSPVRTKILPFAKVECARFKGSSMNVFLDQATLELPLHQTPEACLGFIKRNISLSATIGEIYREDRWEYPLEAIREAVINAIVHRDYAQTGSDIKIAIYDDMLEITSPGPLPDTLTIEELRTGRSVIRNRILARIFKEIGFIEAWGSGIPKIHEKVGEYPEIRLNLIESGYGFQVQFEKRTLSGCYSGTGQEPGKCRARTGQVPDKLKLLEFCRDERSTKEMMSILNLNHRETFTQNYLHPLMKNRLLGMTIPDKPRSPKQKYRTTEAGIKKLEKDDFFNL